MPTKEYSYICLTHNDDLCLGVSPHLKIPTHEDSFMLQLKRRTNNEKKEADYRKMRWDIDHLNNTISLSAVSEPSRLCISKRKSPHAKFTNDVVLVNCEYKEEIDKWDMGFNLESGTIQLVGTELCLTAMQCLDNERNGYCNPRSTKLVKLARKGKWDKFVEGTYVKAYPCHNGNHPDRKTGIEESQTFRSTLDCALGCSPLFAGNGRCDESCRNEACGFDGDECETLAPTPPTMDPTPSPSVFPTPNPSQSPTLRPSKHPTHSPVTKPSSSPSVHPSLHPSVHPSLSPSAQPSLSPSVHPSLSPSAQPSPSPTTNVTIAPSNPKFVVAEPTIGPTTDGCTDSWIVCFWWILLIGILLFMLLVYVSKDQHDTYQKRKAKQLAKEEEKKRKELQEQVLDPFDPSERSGSSSPTPAAIYSLAEDDSDFDSDSDSDKKETNSNEEILHHMILDQDLESNTNSEVRAVMEGEVSDSSDDSSVYSGDYIVEQVPLGDQSRKYLGEDLYQMQQLQSDSDFELESSTEKDEDIPKFSNKIQRHSFRVNQKRKRFLIELGPNPTVERRTRKSEEAIRLGEEKRQRARERKRKRNNK
ncbi:MAG: LNR domain-containing protein [Promethearchaeota archaeon]